MNHSKVTIFALALAAACQMNVAAAGELIVTPSGENSKSGSALVSLDISSNGDVSGFNFFVRTGELKAGSVDISKCTSELPKGFSGYCAQRADGVGVIAYAEGKQTLPAGVISVGKLGLPAEVLSKQGGVLIEELTFADVNGEVIQSKSMIAQ